MHTITTAAFENIQIQMISKIKIRRKYEPYTKELPSDSMVLKVCCGNNDTYYTSTVDNIEEMYIKIFWAKMAKMNKISNLYVNYNMEIEG